MDRKQFEKIVGEVLDGLPEDFAEKLENIEIIVQDRPSPEELERAGVGEGSGLLGLYQGVPNTSRGRGYMLVLPDRISIYMEPIQLVSEARGIPESAMIREVVLHEVAHYFGLPDSRLRELGY